MTAGDALTLPRRTSSSVTPAPAPPAHAVSVLKIERRAASFRPPARPQQDMATTGARNRLTSMVWVKPNASGSLKAAVRRLQRGSVHIPGRC